ncbi:unnamed protein product, partial [Amoebophrya sp. A25]
EDHDGAQDTLLQLSSRSTQEVRSARQHWDATKLLSKKESCAADFVEDAVMEEFYAGQQQQEQERERAIMDQLQRSGTATASSSLSRRLSQAFYAGQQQHETSTEQVVGEEDASKVRALKPVFREQPELVTEIERAMQIKEDNNMLVDTAHQDPQKSQDQQKLLVPG